MSSATETEGGRRSPTAYEATYPSNMPRKGLGSSRGRLLAGWRPGGGGETACRKRGDSMRSGGLFWIPRNAHRLDCPVRFRELEARLDRKPPAAQPYSPYNRHSP
jgi:hypothetical protein